MTKNGTAMKKNTLLFAAFAALLTCSCQNELPLDVPSEEEGEITVLTAGFAGEEDETRTVRQADGKVFWSPKDEISLVRFYANKSDNKKFTATNTAPAASTNFSGSMPSGSGAYWAVYPYSSGNNIQTVQGTKFLVTSLPAKQEAVAGSFADDLFISAAYVKSNAKHLAFHHVCGGVKFSVTEPGVKQVTLLPTDGGVALAGLFGLYASGTDEVPYIAITGSDDSMDNTLKLTAPEGKTLEVGAAYHFVTMPVSMKGGFTLLFEKEDGSFAVRKVTKDVTVEAGHFATLMDADSGLSYRKDFIDYTPGDVTIDGLGGLFSITVTGTMEYHIDSYSDWIKEVSATGDLRLGRQHGFLAERNDEGAERSGMLTLCYGDNCYPIMVTQTAMGDLKVLPHHTLGMRFTATWCQHCPTMDETFRKAKAAMGDAFDYVCIYATSGNYYFDGSNGLNNYYQIGGFPSGIIDGRFDLPNYSSTDYGASVIAQTAEETVKYYPTATAIGVESSVSGRNVTVKVDVMAQFEEDYKLTIFLCENNVIGPQQKGSTEIPDFNHSRVTRMSLTHYLGDQFEGPEAGDVKSFTYTATVPSSYNLSNMDVVAFVQRNFNGRPAMQSAPYGDWYVDNCRSAALGAKAPLEVQ